MRRALRQLGEPYASAAQSGLHALGRHADTVSISNTRLTSAAEAVLGRSPLQWVATGKVTSLVKGGRIRRALAEVGLDMPVRRLRLD